MSDTDAVSFSNVLFFKYTLAQGIDIVISILGGVLNPNRFGGFFDDIFIICYQL